mgnify:CR=1 FL=1
MAASGPVRQERQRQQESRVKVLEGYYQSYSQGGGSWHYPCAELKTFQNFEQALQVAQEMSKIGRDLYPHDTPTQTGWHYSASFWRSPEEVEALLQASDAQVAADYQAEIEAFNNLQIQTLQDQLVAQELAKEARKEEEKLNSIKAKALAAAQAHIASQLKEGK